MSGTSAWVCIYILEGGHFSIPDADANLGMTGLALIERLLDGSIRLIMN
jgi:hypothetical protein